MRVGLVFLLTGILPAAGAAAEDTLYFPPAKGDWAKAVPSERGWDADKLQQALALAGEQKSSGVVILHRGRLLAEQYWELDVQPRKGLGLRGAYRRTLHGKDADGHAIEDVASVQKSVAAVLAQIAMEKGLLKADDPVGKHLGEGWSKATAEQEKKIQLQHLLTMTSGLTDRLEFEADPGSRWRYNTAAYSRTMTVLEAVSKQDRNQLTQQWLTEPLGMSDTKWVERPRIGAATTNSHGLATTARDLARFGLLALAGGEWSGRRIVAAQRIEQVRMPSQTLNPSYGELWWLNGQKWVRRGPGRIRTRGPLNAEAPSDLTAGLGALGRKLYVVPSLQLVVTRLGDAPGAKFDAEFWKRLAAAAPHR